MPAYLRDEDVVTLKWVGGYPANKEKGLPYISGLIVVNDAETGLPVAVMDGAEITAARTAAAAPSASRFAWEWRRPRSRLRRAGALPRAALRAQPAVEIRAWDPHPERPAGDLLAPAAAGRTRSQVPGGRDRRADRRGPAPPPRPERSASCALPIDFDYFDGAVATADLLADDVGQFSTTAAGALPELPARRSIGRASAARLAGPRLCCNLGIGALDAAFANVVLERARAAGAGTELEL
jgi:hypothetical protein